MQNLVNRRFVIVGAASSLLLSNNAYACDMNTACDRASIQANRDTYRGPLAQTTQQMVGLWALAHEPTELVLADGDQRSREVVTGVVLTSWRPQKEQWRPWSRDAQFWVRPIYFPRAMLKEKNQPSADFRSALTLCNGTKLNQPDRNRSVWRRKVDQPQYLWTKQRLPEVDPTSLLGSTISARYDL